jgi:hypothetical protein
VSRPQVTDWLGTLLGKVEKKFGRMTATKAETRDMSSSTAIPIIFIGCGTRGCSGTSPATRKHSRQSRVLSQ